MGADTLIGVQPQLRDYLNSVTTAPLDTDGTLAANSDTVAPSQKAVKTYVDTGLATKGEVGSKPIEAANAVTVTPNCSAVLSTTGTTVLTKTAIIDGSEFNLISSAAVTISIDFGVGVSVFAAGVTGTGDRYVKFGAAVGTSCKVVRLSSTSYYLTSYVGDVTIADAP